MDAAAALELRGYGGACAGRRGVRERLPWSRDDRAFALAALLLVVVPVAVRLSGAAGFDPYPLLRADAGAAGRRAPRARCRGRRSRRSRSRCAVVLAARPSGAGACLTC